MLKKIVVPCLLLVVCSLLVPGTTSALPPAIKAKSKFMLADELYKKGEYWKAIEPAEEAKKLLGKTNSKIEHLLTKAYFKKGEFNKALESINAFFEVTPESESGSQLYAEMLSLYSKIELGIKLVNNRNNYIYETLNLDAFSINNLAFSHNSNGRYKKYMIKDVVQHIEYMRFNTTDFDQNGSEKLLDVMESIKALSWINEKRIYVVEHLEFINYERKKLSELYGIQKDRINIHVRNFSIDDVLYMDSGSDVYFFVARDKKKCLEEKIDFALDKNNKYKTKYYKGECRDNEHGVLTFPIKEKNMSSSARIDGWYRAEHPVEKIYDDINKLRKSID